MPAGGTMKRFNGATAMEPRKSAGDVAGAPQLRTASMGPRQWSRGRGRTSSRIRRMRESLQWGHGNGAVEEGSVPVCSRRGLRAGVLSRPLLGGRGKRAGVLAARGRLLQWGHGNGAVEEPPTPEQRPKTGLEPSRVVLYPFAQHSVRH